MKTVGRVQVLWLMSVVLLHCTKSETTPESSTELSPKPAASVLPVLMEVPSFELINQDGEVVSRESLLGEVWVAGFIFTRCQTVCPGISAKMKAIAAISSKTAEELKLVSVSVDPEHDTPTILKDYAKRLQVDTSRWQFLTGPRPQVEALVTHGMKQLMIPRSGAPDGTMDIMHGGDLILVDRKGLVRGRYKYRKVDSKKLVEDARSLH
jgi:protein SCO1